MQNTVTERRQAPRIAATLPVVMGAAGGRQEAHVCNISRNGICCVVPQRIAEMTRLHFEMDVPLGKQNARVHGVGVVVRCQDAAANGGFEVAVLFTELDPTSRLSVSRYVSAHRQ
jgi:hypothetical protein